MASSCSFAIFSVSSSVSSKLTLLSKGVSRFAASDFVEGGKVILISPMQ